MSTTTQVSTIITADQSWADQERLEELCADRPLESVEIANVNAFYGHARVMKLYAHLPVDEPLYGVIPHSPSPDPWFVWHGEVRPRLPAILCYPDYRIPAYEATTRARVIPSASPYLYVLALTGYRSGDKGTDRHGTIFFPAHSTHHVAVDLEGERLAESLSQVDDRWRPITVCMYWRDIEMGRHRPFQAAGFRVVSAGHMFDPSFLFRFHHLCSGHRYAAGSTIGSHALLAVASGCMYRHLPEAGAIPRFALEGARTSATHGVRLPGQVVSPGYPTFREVFVTAEPDEQEQRHIAGRLLGLHHVRSSDELRQELVRLRRFDRVQVFVPRSDGRRIVAAPPAIRRVAQRVRRRLKLRTRAKRALSWLRRDRG